MLVVRRVFVKAGVVWFSRAWRTALEMGEQE